MQVMDKAEYSAMEIRLLGSEHGGNRVHVRLMSWRPVTSESKSILTHDAAVGLERKS